MMRASLATDCSELVKESGLIHTLSFGPHRHKSMRLKRFHKANAKNLVYVSRKFHRLSVLHGSPGSVDVPGGGAGGRMALRVRGSDGAGPVVPSVGSAPGVGSPQR